MNASLSPAGGGSTSTINRFHLGWILYVFDLKHISIAFLSFACPKERNKEKGSQKQMLRCFWQANAHEHSDNL
jgi:hypothetical protein